MSELLKESDYRDKGNVLVKVDYDSSTETEQISEIALKTDLEHKDVVQSYILTVAKYDFSVYEKRILYRIIQCFQFQLEGKKLDKGFLIDKNLYGDVNIVLPLSSLLADKEDENYSRIKKALKDLQKRLVEYDNKEGVWQILNLITKSKVNRYSRQVSFTIYNEIYEALLNFSKGYRKFELEAAMTFRSVYAMRFYELLSGQTTPLTYSMENLRAMLRLENKYERVDGFIKKIIDPAKRELDKKSPYSFTYELVHEKERTNPKGGRKKIVGITFTPVYHPEHRDKLLAYKEARRDFDLSEVFAYEEIQSLLSLGFTEQELKNKYYDLLEEIGRVRRQGKVLISAVIIDYARKSADPKSYVIRSLKKELKRWREGLLEKKPTKLSAPEKKEVVECKSKERSLRSFLSDYLPTEDIEKSVSYFMEHGTERLNRIVILCEGKKDKIRECIQILIK